MPDMCVFTLSRKWTWTARSFVPVRSWCSAGVKVSPYSGNDHFLFPAAHEEEKKSVTRDMVLKKVLRSALVRAKINGKRIGWHSFRHSLAINLRTLKRT